MRLAAELGRRLLHEPPVLVDTRARERLEPIVLQDHVALRRALAAEEAFRAAAARAVRRVLLEVDALRAARLRRVVLRAVLARRGGEQLPALVDVRARDPLELRERQLVACRERRERQTMSCFVSRVPIQ